MKNRAKCKLCRDIIESFHPTDYAQCKCGEISVDGGQAMRCSANDWVNFFRLDEFGREIVVKVENADVKPLDIYTKPSRKELIQMLKEMSDSIESLPENGMHAPVTHYDHWSLIALLHSILKED